MPCLHNTKQLLLRVSTLVLFGAMAASLPAAPRLLAQSPGPPPDASSAPARPHEGPGSFGPRRPPMERAFRMGPRGRWWDNPQIAQKIGLSQDQQKKMDDIFQQSRLKLIDQHAAVEKEEAILEPMLAVDQPDEGRILSQIDKVAQSRAELEKANARMLLGLRRVLTTQQWQSLRTLEPERREHDDRGGSRGRGPDSPAGGPPPGPAGDGAL
jgi:protein CpxP